MPLEPEAMLKMPGAHSDGTGGDGHVQGCILLCVSCLECGHCRVYMPSRHSPTAFEHNRI